MFAETKHNDFKILGKSNLINKNIKIGRNVIIYPDVTFWGDGEIIIGDESCIGQGTIIFASKENNGLSIGKNTHISAYCYIIDMDHGINKNMKIFEQENVYSPISIGNDVWIGAGCKILKGSVISDGAVVGAGSVVKDYLPECSVSVGIPSHVIKYRK